MIALGARVVLGGTAEEDSWSKAIDDAAERDIVERGTALEPRLRGARVVSRAAGLRPFRVRVRVELEQRGGLYVVHNCGNGGSGWKE